jgi:hypothetical protein
MIDYVIFRLGTYPQDSGTRPHVLLGGFLPNLAWSKEGDAAQLLNVLTEHIRVLHSLSRLRLECDFETRGKKRDRHIGMLLVLEMASNLSRPQPIELLSDRMRVSPIFRGNQSLLDGPMEFFVRIARRIH